MSFAKERSKPIKFEDLIKESVSKVIDLSGLRCGDRQKFLDQLKKFATSEDPKTWSNRSSRRFSFSEMYGKFSHQNASFGIHNSLDIESR
ncbi:hypothetical protein N431DRAFT_83543 [Stipitochalara longipes BDJ]|nr:hypothetical protein N431DRAFT_83543 [Stipitochalara longipes BDJ]